jgi:hypothetical protein
MKYHARLPLKLPILIQLAKKYPYTTMHLTILANSPSRAQISDLSSCVRSCDVKMKVLYVYLYKTGDL